MTAAVAVESIEFNFNTPPPPPPAPLMYPSMPDLKKFPKMEKEIEPKKDIYYYYDVDSPHYDEDPTRCCIETSSDWGGKENVAPGGGGGGGGDEVEWIVDVEEEDDDDADGDEEMIDIHFKWITNLIGGMQYRLEDETSQPASHTHTVEAGFSPKDNFPLLVKITCLSKYCMSSEITLNKMQWDDMTSKGFRESYKEFYQDNSNVISSSMRSEPYRNRLNVLKTNPGDKDVGTIVVDFKILNHKPCVFLGVADKSIILEKKPFEKLLSLRRIIKDDLQRLKVSNFPDFYRSSVIEIADVLRTGLYNEDRKHPIKGRSFNEWNETILMCGAYFVHNRDSNFSIHEKNFSCLAQVVKLFPKKFIDDTLRQYEKEECRKKDASEAVRKIYAEVFV